MATINSKGHLTGTVGPVSYRIVRGKTIVQSKPGRGNVNQSLATKKRASEFGMAQQIAKKIRTALFPLLQNKTDSTCYYRFGSKVYQAMLGNSAVPQSARSLATGDLALLDRFQFNENSPFENFCSVPITVAENETGGLVLSIPDFRVAEAILPNPLATAAKLCLLVTGFDTEQYSESFSEIVTLEIPFHVATVAAQEWVLATVPAGHLMVVTAALFYLKQDRIMGAVVLNDQELHPCEIVAAYKS
jgi:hypothetical protein